MKTGCQKCLHCVLGSMSLVSLNFKILHKKYFYAVKEI